MAVFVSKKDFDLCWDYCSIIDECIQYRDGWCCGWSTRNYADNVCLWKCLTAKRELVITDLQVLCNSDLVAESDIVREICRSLRQQGVIS